MADGNFFVVEFIDSEDLATVPSPWISETVCGLECSYPPGHRKLARKLARVNHAPDTTWSKHPCRILHAFDTFEAAIKKERFLESFSHFSDPPEHEHRLRKRQRKSYTTYSSSEDEKEVTPTSTVPIIAHIRGSSAAVALPDVSSSVNLTEQQSSSQDELSNDRVSRVSRDLDFNGRLERLERCCSAIQRDVRQILAVLQSQNDSQVISLETLDFVENHLPLSSLPSLYELESQLTDSLEKREELRLHLQQLGGSTSDEMVKRILRHLFTDDLAQHFSWMGQKGKNKLCDLLVMKVIFHAVETSKLGGTRELILKRIKDWFRQAGTRNKYVIERQSSRSFYFQQFSC